MSQHDLRKAGAPLWPHPDDRDSLSEEEIEAEIEADKRDAERDAEREREKEIALENAKSIRFQENMKKIPSTIDLLIEKNEKLETRIEKLIETNIALVNEINLQIIRTNRSIDFIYSRIPFSFQSRYPRPDTNWSSKPIIDKFRKL